MNKDYFFAKVMGQAVHKLTLLFIAAILFLLPLSGKQNLSDSAVSEYVEMKKSSVIIYYGFGGEQTQKIGITGNAELDSLKIENFLKEKNIQPQSTIPARNVVNPILKKDSESNSKDKQVNAVQKVGEWSSSSNDDEVDLDSDKKKNK